MDEENKAPDANSARWGFLLTGSLGAFTAFALAIMVAWNLFAESLHFPQLSFWSAAGLLGLLLIVVVIVTAAYVIAVKEWD
jgi:hypothetical protein